MAEIPQALLPTEAISDLDAQNAAALSQPQQAPAQPAPYTVPLLQNDTDVVIPVSQDEADVAVRSGLYSPKNDQEFIVLDKYGNRNIIPGQHLRDALNDGMRLESGEERYRRELQEQHGDSEIATGIESTFRGALAIPSLLSAGLPGQEGEAMFTPDGVMEELGLDREEMQKRAEANPIVSALGNIAGSIGGGGVTGINAGTKALEKAITKTIIKDATKAGVATKVAANLASKVAGNAVEGAYFATGELVSEASLGRADVNAENLLAAAGMGALFGGTIGGVIGGAHSAISAVVKAGKFIASPLLKQADNAIDGDVAAARLLGLTPTQYAKVIEKNPQVGNGIKGYLKDDLKLSMSDTAEELLSKNNAVKKAAGEEIESALKELDSALEFRTDLKPKKSVVWSNVHDRIEKEYGSWLSDTGVAGGDKIRRPVEKFLKDVKKLSQQEGTFTAGDLQKLKRMQDDLMNYEKAPGKWTVFEDLVHSTRTALKEEIDLVADNLLDAGTRVDLGAKLKSANRRYASSSTYGDFLEKRALKAGDKELTFMGAARDAGLDISRKLAVLGQIEKAQMKTTKLIDSAVKNFINPAAEKASKLPLKQIKQTVPASIMQSDFAKKYENGKYRKAKSVDEAFVNLNDNFTR
jgi:hypothetical protein